MKSLVDYMLEGIAETEELRGALAGSADGEHDSVVDRTCAIGAVHYSILKEFLGRPPKVHEIYNNDINHPFFLKIELIRLRLPGNERISVDHANDDYGRDEAVRLLKEWHDENPN